MERAERAWHCLHSWHSSAVENPQMGYKRLGNWEIMIPTNWNSIWHIYSHILSGIQSDTLSGIRSNISSDILSDILHSQLRSRSAHWDLALAVDGGVRGGRWRMRTRRTRTRRTRRTRTRNHLVSELFQGKKFRNPWDFARFYLQKPSNVELSTAVSFQFT